MWGSLSPGWVCTQVMHARWQKLKLVIVIVDRLSYIYVSG